MAEEDDLIQEADRGVIRELERRNALLQQHINATDGLRTEVGALRAELLERPTLRKVRAERRRAVIVITVIGVVLMLLTSYAAVSAHDVFRDQCILGPQVQGQEAPSWCDNTFFPLRGASQ